MNREEILLKSQNEKKDEGKEYMYSCGRKSGVIGMMAIFLFLAVYHQYTDAREQNYPLLCIIFGYLTAESLGIYQVTKRKRELVKIGAGLILCLAFLVLTIT